MPNNRLLKYLKFNNQLLLDNMSGPRTKLPVTPVVSVLTEVVTKDLISVHMASSWVLTSRLCLVGLLLWFPAENLASPQSGPALQLSSAFPLQRPLPVEA